MEMIIFRYFFDYLGSDVPTTILPKFNHRCSLNHNQALVEMLIISWINTVNH